MDSTPENEPDSDLDQSPSAAPTLPGRIMALDLGDRRIGIALTDPLGYTAQPLMTLYRKAPRADLKSIARLIRKHGVTEVIVGRPLHLSGELSPRARKAEEFAQALHAEAAVPVRLWDERLSTWEAHQLLDQTSAHSAARKPARPTAKQAAAARQSRDRIIDQVAAVLILESYMQSHKEGGERS